MISLTLVSTLFLTQSAFGTYGEFREVVLPITCDVCGVRIAAVESTIIRLKTSRRAQDRENAAKDLARFHGACHPEILSALSDAMLFDSKDDVREEAARSLGRLGASGQKVQLALQRAARFDRDRDVRLAAGGTLQALRSQALHEVIVQTPYSVRVNRVGSSGEVIVPGTVRIIESKPSSRVAPAEIVSSSPPEDVPPPPSPVPVFRRSTPSAPPLPTETSIRRSSAKPVSPSSETAPSDLPPLEGPTR